MANFNITYFSPCLRFNTSLKVFVPTPSVDEVMSKRTINYFHRDVKYPVLYLLNDVYSDSSDWLNFTNIMRYAQEKHIVVVLPSVGNSFYQDMYKGSRYKTYLSEELPKFIERYFPVSKEKQNTFIGGVSVGGYGALNIALNRPEKFGKVFSIAGLLDLDDNSINKIYKNQIDLESLFENFKNNKHYNKNFTNQINISVKEFLNQKPNIFLSCKKNSSLYQMHLEYLDKLKQNNFETVFEENKEELDNWSFCDKSIEKALNWIASDEERILKITE